MKCLPRLCKQVAKFSNGIRQQYSPNPARAQPAHARKRKAFQKA